MALFAFHGAGFVFPVAFFALEMVSEYEPMNVLPLFFGGAVASDAPLYRVPLFPDIFSASVIMVAIRAFYAIVFNMGEVSKPNGLVMNLPPIALV